MSDTNELKIVITGDNASGKKALEETQLGVKNLGNESTDTEQKNETLTDSLGKLAGAFAVVVASVDFLKTGFVEFAKGQTEILGLNQTLKNLGSFTESASRKMQSFADTMSRMSGIEDEQITSMMTYGLNLGIASDQIEQATKNAVGLSSAFKLDLNQSMKLTQGYLEGNIDKMTKVLPILKDMGSDTEKMAFVQQKMNDGLLLSQARMSGSEGSMIQLHKSFGDFQKLIGEALEPMLKKIIDTLNGMMEVILNASPGVKILVGVVASLVVALGTIPPAITLIRTALALLNLNPIMLIISGVLVALTSVIIGFDKLNKNAHSLDAINKEWERMNNIMKMNQANMDRANKNLQDLAKKEGDWTNINKKAQEEIVKQSAISIEANKKELAEIQARIDAKKNELGLDVLNSNTRIGLKASEKEFADKVDNDFLLAEEQLFTVKQNNFDREQLAQQKAFDTKKKYIDLGLRATMDAVMQEGVTVAKVLGATLRAIARQISEELLLKSIGAFAMGNIFGGGALAMASGTVLFGGNQIASEIENHPIKMFADGGIITEPIMGVGASGQRYMFGEAGSERVTPMNGNNSYSDTMSIGVVNVYTNDPDDFRKQLMMIQKRTNSKMVRR